MQMTQRLLLQEAGVGGSISGKADSAHTHTESDISDLKNYLESATATVLLQGKAEVTHTHLRVKSPT